MVIAQATPNSWYQTARAAYAEPAKQKFLRELGKALASDNPEYFAPPLRQIMSIGRVIGADRVADVLAVALQRNNLAAKDERLAEALLDLAAEGSKKALDVIGSVSSPDSGYVAARQWYQVFLDRCGYKLDYAVGKDLRDLNSRVKILVQAGYQSKSMLSGAEARIAEIRGVVVGDNQHLEDASARLNWFFVHGSEIDRTKLQAAFSEYATHAGPSKGDYRKRLVAIRRGAALLLELERNYAHKIKDSITLKAIAAAERSMEIFFGGELKVSPSSTPAPSHQPGPIDQFREELGKKDVSLERLKKLAKQIGEAGVLQIITPLMATSGDQHVGAITFVKFLNTETAVSMLAEAAPSSLAAATALADIASGYTSANFNVCKAASKAFWQSQNFEPIFKTPTKYCNLQRSSTKSHAGVFESSEQAESFVRSVVFPRENVREALGVLYELRKNSIIDPQDKRAPILALLNRKELGAVMLDYFARLSPDDINRLSWTEDYDAFLYQSVKQLDGAVLPDKLNAVVNFYARSGEAKENHLPRRFLLFCLAFIPTAEQPRYFSVFVRTEDWDRLAAALYDWCHETNRAGFNFQSTFDSLTSSQLRQVIQRVDKVRDLLVKNGANLVVADRQANLAIKTATDAAASRS